MADLLPAQPYPHAEKPRQNPRDMILFSCSIYFLAYQFVMMATLMLEEEGKSSNPQLRTEEGRERHQRAA